MRRLVVVLLVSSACAEPSTYGRVGEPAPAFAAPTLSGDSLVLADLRGQPVLLNLWATWCIPCRKEVPELQALHEKHAARGLIVVGVSVDDGSADDAVRDFVKEFGLTYTILRDPTQSVYAAFFVPGVPATFLIDRTGKVAWRLMGPFRSSDPQLVTALQQVL
jgi:cytochrome c biogenesis protein CcmG, thiol:disulfide interchange protein DsbE